MRWSPRLGALGGASMLVFAACSSSGDDLRTVASNAEVGSAPVPLPAAGEPDAGGPAVTPVMRWGDGRAVAARYDTTGHRTAVVTTVGIAVHDDAGSAPTTVAELTEPAAEVDLDPTGRLLAVVGERSSTVTVWDLTAGAIAGAPFATGDRVTGVDFAPDGSALIVSTPTTVTRVALDGGAAAPLIDAQTAQGALGPAAVAADGASVAAPVADAAAVRIAVWRPEGSSLVQLDVAGGVDAREVVIDPTGTRAGVVTGFVDDPLEARLAIWDVATSAVTGVIPLGDGAESPWTFGSDGRVLVVDGGAAVLWSSTGQQLAALDIAPDVAVQRVFGITGGGFVTILQDGAIDVWNGDGARLASAAPGAALVDASLSADGTTLTTVDFLGGVRRWSVDAGAGSDQLAGTVVLGGVGVVNSVVFAPDGSGLALATSGGVVETIDDTGAVVRTFDQKVGNVDSVAFSPDASTIASAMGQRLGPESFDDTVTIFDAGSGGASTSFGGEAEQVAGCAFFRNEVRFSPDGSLLAANSHDFTVSLYDATDGSILHTFPAHQSTVTDLAFSPDGTLLATTSDDSRLRVWSVADRELVHEYQTPAGGYWSLVFGADGQTLVVADLPGNVSMIAIDDGSVVRTFAGQKDRFAELAISPDGSLVASGGAGNTVELWETASGELLAQLPGHAAPVTTVAFSADGTRLASGSLDATVRLWAL